MSDQEYEVDLSVPDEIRDFIETHRRDDVDLFTGVQNFIAATLAKWKEERKDHWPACTRLRGPKVCTIASGPLEGQTVPIYEFQIYAAPIETVGREEATKQMELFRLGLRIENDELVEIIEEATIN